MNNHETIIYVGSNKFYTFRWKRKFCSFTFVTYKFYMNNIHKSRRNNNMYMYIFFFFTDPFLEFYINIFILYNIVYP